MEKALFNLPLWLNWVLLSDSDDVSHGKSFANRATQSSSHGKDNIQALPTSKAEVLLASFYTGHGICSASLCGAVYETILSFLA